MNVQVHRNRVETLLSIVGLRASASAGRYVSVMRSGDGSSGLRPPSWAWPSLSNAVLCKPIKTAHATPTVHGRHARATKPAISCTATTNPTAPTIHAAAIHECMKRFFNIGCWHARYEEMNKNKISADAPGLSLRQASNPKT